MVQALTKLVTFDEFIAWYPENSKHRYELHNGVIVEMPRAPGKHSEVAGFVVLELSLETGQTHHVNKREFYRACCDYYR